MECRVGRKGAGLRTTLKVHGKFLLLQARSERQGCVNGIGEPDLRALDDLLNYEFCNC
jgi:hypothetical protein